MFDESLADFFVDFGEPLTLPGASEPVPCFVDAPTEPALIGKIEAQLCRSVLTCMTADVVSLREGSVVSVRGASYVVRFAQPEGAGVTYIGIVEESSTEPASGTWR